MADPRHVRPDEVEILAARELRKAGLDLASLRVHARRSLAPDDRDGYVMELSGLTTLEDARRVVLVEFRNHAAPVDQAAVQGLATRTAASPPNDAPKRLHWVTEAPARGALEPPLRAMLATSAFEPAAVREALASGVTLLRIADGPAAFLRSQWAMGDQPPAWVPEYMAERVDLGPRGEVRYQLLVSRKRST
jgi:hypothetical protein